MNANNAWLLRYNIYLYLPRKEINPYNPHSSPSMSHAAGG
jgi:hypothetical protein